MIFLLMRNNNAQNGGQFPYKITRTVLLKEKLSQKRIARIFGNYVKAYPRT